MKARKLCIAALQAGLLLAAVLCRLQNAEAVSTVAVSSSGNGVFSVQGIGIEGAAAFEINVGYDTATLANPRVVSGALVAGAMTAINTNVAGAVRMVMIRLAPVSGSGVIATLTFDRTGSSGGKITSLAAKLVNSQGARIASLTQIQNPSDETAAGSTESPTRETQAGAGQTAQPAGPSAAQPGGTTIIIAGPSERTAESKSAPEAGGTTEGGATARPESGGEDRTGSSVTAKADASGSGAAQDGISSKRKMYEQTSVLERFREYRGERTVGAFVALFDQEGNFWCRQDPPVALSDGRTAVRITFITTPGRKTASDIAVMGARLISLKEDSENTNTWVAELMPEKGIYRANVAVAQGDVTMICPLTIAPPVTSGDSRSGTMTGGDMARYLGGQRTGSPRALDMNRDGKVDYIDDYIATANYLAGTSASKGRKQ